MSANIRYPNITGGTEREQIAQIKSYLRQLVDQLNYALPDRGAGTESAQAPVSSGPINSDLAYYIRTAIAREVQKAMENLPETTGADTPNDTGNLTQELEE